MSANSATQDTSDTHAHLNVEVAITELVSRARGLQEPPRETTTAQKDISAADLLDPDVLPRLLRSISQLKDPGALRLLGNAAAVIHQGANQNNIHSILGLDQERNHDNGGPNRTSKNPKFNADRCKPGMCSYIHKLERMYSTSTGIFEDIFVSSPMGPGIDKGYWAIVHYVTPKYISVHALVTDG